MLSYIAHDKSCGTVHQGGLHACLNWALSRVQNHPKAIIAILRLRPSEDGRVIAEVDNTGGRWIFGGRYLPKREVSRLTRRAAHG